MTFLRDLVRDLAERRLWPLVALPPLAVVLLVALGGAGDPAPPAAGPVPAAAPAGLQRELEVLGSRRDRPVPAVEPPASAVRRDPFAGGTAPAAARRGQRTAPRRRASATEVVAAAQRRAEARAREAAAASSGATAARPAPGAPVSSGVPAARPAPAAPASSGVPAARPAPAAASASPGSGPAGAAPVATGAAPTRSAAGAASAPSARRVADLRLSREGRVARARRGVPALAALPSAAGPVLAVRTVGEEVVSFAPLPGLRVAGGRCLPSRATCRVLRVRVGRTARLALPGGPAFGLRVLATRERRGAPAPGTGRGAPACFGTALRLADAVPTTARWLRAVRACHPA